MNSGRYDDSRVRFVSSDEEALLNGGWTQVSKDVESSLVGPSSSRLSLASSLGLSESVLSRSDLKKYDKIRAGRRILISAQTSENKRLNNVFTVSVVK